MNKLFNNSSIGKIFFLFLSTTLLIGFFFNEDLSTGGAAADFYTTLDYKLSLKENLFFSINNAHEWTDEFPLHHILLSSLFYLFKEEYSIRLFYCILSLLIPFLFYLNLKEKFNHLGQNFLLFLASIVFILPSFRYSAIWANSTISAIFFFLISTLFFLKWDKNENDINSKIILSIFFLSLAVYCRQEYAIIFIYLMIFLFQKLKFLDFIKLSTIVFIFSLPGILIYYNQYNLLSTIPDNPLILKTLFSLNKFDDGLLINFSIMSFYLIPIFFFTIINNMKFNKERKFFPIIAITILSFSFIYFLSISFNYNHKVGGGFFLKLSILLFNNNFLFYFTSMIGLILLIRLSLENKNNFILLFLILIGFSGYHYSFQKYLEPLFIIIFFTLIDTKVTLKFLKDYKNLIYLYIYVCIYFIAAIFNNVYQISKNI